MKTTIAGTEIDVNEEGYLTDSTLWNEAVAEAIAAEEKVGPLTDAHWKIIHHLREKHAAGEDVSIRRLNKSGVAPTKEFYALFPGGPLKKAARIAGIPKPASCV